MTLPSSAGLTKSLLGLHSGASRKQVSGAIEAGIIDPDHLHWADVLLLRVLVPVKTVVWAGESDSRNVPFAMPVRAFSAAARTKDAAVRGELDPDAVLVVGREAVEIAAGAQAARVVERLSQGHEATLMLPIGQWWSSLRWLQPGTTADWA